MKPYAFLGVFLILAGAMVIYSALKGSGKAGIARVTVELVKINTNSDGKFLYAEYVFTLNGEEITAKCANRTKKAVGARETMYYDIAKDTLMTEAARRQIITIGAVCAIGGAAIFYFQAATL